ncbi:MAG: Dyp-type peroxidase [bacterium]
MIPHQAGILEGVPPLARYLTFQLVHDTDPRRALTRLSALVSGADTVVGIGPAAVSSMGASIAGLREPPCIEGQGVSIPAQPAALWCWLRGDGRGELLHRSRAVAGAVEDGFVLDSVIDGFLHDGGRDLTGYEDGTENPTGEAALHTAFLSGAGAGLDGSSFVAVQQWVHDLGRFEGFPPPEQDAIIGRRRSDNEEMEAAPDSAHVKRTAQESFEPEAFILRRSMPWADGQSGGLVFVAFGHSFEAFEVQSRRMAGLEDGILDALFRFTRPVSTGYFWCPPVLEGKLDMRALGL